MTTLEFSVDGDLLTATRVGIDEDFLARINQTVVDIRNLKRAQPGVGRVEAHLTSQTGEVYTIVVS
jgi:hypothetical protein